MVAHEHNQLAVSIFSDDDTEAEAEAPFSPRTTAGTNPKTVEDPPRGHALLAVPALMPVPTCQVFLLHSSTGGGGYMQPVAAAIDTGPLLSTHVLIIACASIIILMLPRWCDLLSANDSAPRCTWMSLPHMLSDSEGAPVASTLLLHALLVACFEVRSQWYVDAVASKRTRLARGSHISNKSSACSELCGILTALRMWKPPIPWA